MKFFMKNSTLYVVTCKFLKIDFTGAQTTLDRAVNAVGEAAKAVINESKSSEVISKIFAATEKVHDAKEG